MEKKEVNKCLQCGKVIRSGRADKKFCDGLCKDAYHNSLKILKHQEIKKIDLILKRNREILKKVYKPDTEQLFDRDQMLKAGFEFDYHTHHVITKIKRNEFLFCYDYGYREVKKGWYQVIKRFQL